MRCLAPAGGAEGRSAITALLKLVTATAGKPKAGGAAEEAPAAAEGDGDSDSDEEGGGSKAAAAGPSGRAAAAGGGGGGKKQRLRPLLRPIIAICNDLYAPALRPLRDVARVFHFKKPMASVGGEVVRELGSSCS